MDSIDSQRDRRDLLKSIIVYMVIYQASSG